MNCLQDQENSQKLQSSLCAFLRLEGIIKSIYMDDLIIIGEICEGCLTGSIKARKMFLQLGFLIHPDKSIVSPSQEITYLGFIFDSTNICLHVTDDNV